MIRAEDIEPLDPETPIYDALADEMDERHWAAALARDFPEVAP